MIHCYRHNGWQDVGQNNGEDESACKSSATSQANFEEKSRRQK